jgi:uncharacterized membrane protein
MEFRIRHWISDYFWGKIVTDLVKTRTHFNALAKVLALPHTDLLSVNHYKDISPAAGVSGSESYYKSENNIDVSRNRIGSIDFLRGLVMIIMAIDHIRGYLHFDSLIINPTDVTQTTPALFFTRLITHLCAPTFILLAGTSAYFIAKRKTLRDTSFFLVTRGLWLIALQMTLIRFAWNFDPAFHYNSSNIISTIGFCMICLSVLIHLRLRIIMIVGLVAAAGHNALDTISFEYGSLPDVLWSFLHVKKLYHLGHNYSFLFLYPLIPWFGIMALGYCLGKLYDQDYPAEKRKKILLQIGTASIITFFALRWLNIYGDPTPWAYQQSEGTTIMHFLNIEKYPPSLLFLCFTLGISILLLGLLEGRNLKSLEPITLFGKVPLFYYVVHVFAIHLLAVLAVVCLNFPWQTMIFIGSSAQPSPLLKGKFGFTLAEVYLLWVSTIFFLYPFCSYWLALKTRNRDKWWVSYV